MIPNILNVGYLIYSVAHDIYQVPCSGHYSPMVVLTFINSFWDLSKKKLWGKISCFGKENAWHKRILYLSKWNLESQSIILTKMCRNCHGVQSSLCIPTSTIWFFTFERTLELVHHHVLLSSMVHYVIVHSRNLIVWRGENASEVHRIPANKLRRLFDIIKSASQYFGT